MSEQEIFLAALDINNRGERQAYLESACAGNSSMLRQVQSLLAAHEQSGDFLDVPAMEQGKKGPRTSENDTVALTPGQEDLTLHKDGDPLSTHTDDDGGDADDVLAILDPSKKLGSVGRLAHYEVLEVLGKGGFGTVVRAFDERLQRVVAIKIMSPQMAATSPPRKRFLREARASAKVRHENVVAIYDIQEKPIPYLVMEYVPGETLQQKMDRIGPFDVVETLRIGQQIAAGLAAAHAEHLIHRDIKPANVLLENGSSQRIKITDFGLARAADDASLTQSGMIAGTPMYMAPEQAQGVTLDHRADLFSLGSVLYVMCCGRPPFRAASTLAVMKRVAEDTPRPIREVIPEVPQWLCDFIAKLHEKRPGHRFASAKEVADLLERYLDELRVHGTVKSGATLQHAEKTMETKAEPTVEIARPAANKPAPRPGAWLAVGLVVLLALAAFGVSEMAGYTTVFERMLAPLFESDGRLTLQVDDPALDAGLDGEEPVVRGGGSKEIRLKPGRYRIVAAKDGKVARHQWITIEANGVHAVQFDREPVVITKVDTRTPQLKLTEAWTFKGHNAAVTKARFGLELKSIWTTSHDFSVRQFDRVTGRELNKFDGHTQWVWGLDVSGDGTRLLTCGQDKSVKLWDIATGQVRTGKGHAGVVTNVLFFDRDTKAVSVSWDRTVRIWDLDSMSVENTLIGHEGVIWGLAMSPDQKRLVTGSGDKTIIVWDFVKKERLRTIRGHDGIVGFVAVSNDGERIASTCTDGSVRVWDLATGNQISRYEGHQQHVQGVAFSPDGRYVASSNMSGGIRLTDAASGVELARYAGPAANGSSVTFSPDGATLLAGFHDGTVALLNVVQEKAGAK